jgi:hypothetical protein
MRRLKRRFCDPGDMYAEKRYTMPIYAETIPPPLEKAIARECLWPEVHWAIGYSKDAQSSHRVSSATSARTLKSMAHDARSPPCVHTYPRNKRQPGMSTSAHPKIPIS